MREIEKQLMEEDHEIVVLGGGICGLATALALHRKGLRNVVVFEKSEKLRAEGAAIGILANGWRALDQLGVGSQLRQQTFLLRGGRDVWIDQGNQPLKQQEMQFLTGEARCLKRSDLMEALANALPPGTIHFAHEIVDLKMNPRTLHPTLQTSHGKFIHTKVLIGCDGSKSIVADYLGLKPIKKFALWATRGLTYYPDGHGFAPEFFRLRKDKTMLGRAPVNEHLVYWFVCHPFTQFDSKFPQNPESIKHFTLETMIGFPDAVIAMIEGSNVDSLSFAHLRYRAPWDILMGKFCKGPIAVAGDAMHVMGPFLGQGGSAGIEDAVVLARNLAQKIGSDNPHDFGSEMPSASYEKVEEAFRHYVEERRTRVLLLSTQTYLTGTIVGTMSPVVKFIAIILMVILFTDQGRHTKYDCGRL